MERGRWCTELARGIGRGERGVLLADMYEPDLAKRAEDPWDVFARSYHARALPVRVRSAFGAVLRGFRRGASGSVAIKVQPVAPTGAADAFLAARETAVAFHLDAELGRIPRFPFFARPVDAFWAGRDRLGAFAGRKRPVDGPYFVLVVEWVDGERVDPLAFASDADLFSFLALLAFSMWVAYDRCGFVHRDLHPGNVLARTLPRDVGRFELRFDGGDALALRAPELVGGARVAPCVIDYGLATSRVVPAEASGFWCAGKTYPRIKDEGDRLRASAEDVARIFYSMGSWGSCESTGARESLVSAARAAAAAGSAPWRAVFEALCDRLRRAGRDPAARAERSVPADTILSIDVRRGPSSWFF